MSGIESLQTPEMPIVAQQPGFIERNARKIALAGALGFVGTGSGVLFSEGSAAAAAPAAVSAKAAMANCDNFVSSNAASNANRYNIDAFLPNSSFNNETGGSAYETSLFGKRGPLAGKGDVASLAAVEAAIVGPAQKSNLNVANYDYSAAFNTYYKKFTEQGGHQAAIKACDQSYRTLVDTGHYMTAWNTNSAHVYELMPVAKGNHIGGLNVELIPGIAVLSGEEYDKGSLTNKSIKRFDAVLVTPAGQMFVESNVPIKVSSNNQSTTKQNKGGSVGINSLGAGFKGPNQTGGGTHPEGSPGSPEKTPGAPTTTPNTVPTTTPNTVPTTTPNTVPTTTPNTVPTTTPNTVPTTTPNTVPTTTPTTQPEKGSNPGGGTN